MVKKEDRTEVGKTTLGQKKRSEFQRKIAEALLPLSAMINSEERRLSSSEHFSAVFNRMPPKGEQGLF